MADLDLGLCFFKFSPTGKRHKLNGSLFIGTIIFIVTLLSFRTFNKPHNNLLLTVPMRCFCNCHCSSAAYLSSNFIVRFIYDSLVAIDICWERAVLNLNIHTSYFSHTVNYSHEYITFWNV